MGYWILFVLACWIGFGVIAAPILPDDQRGFAFTSAIGALFVFAFIESIIKSLQQKKWTRRVAYVPALRDLPPVKLSVSLLVDDQLRAFAGSVIDDAPSGAASQTSADVKRLYEVLDE